MRTRCFQRIGVAIFLLTVACPPALLWAENLNEILLTTAETGELEGLQRTLKLGANIDFRGGDNQWSALMTASYRGHREIVKFLLSKGAQVDLHDRMGQTALMAAVSTEKQELEIIKMLLTYGANVNHRRKRDGWTPLMLAAKGGRMEEVKILLEFGADPALQNQSGEKAFDIATIGEFQELAELLRPKS